MSFLVCGGHPWHQRTRATSSEMVMARCCRSGDSHLKRRSGSRSWPSFCLRWSNFMGATMWLLRRPSVNLHILLRKENSAQRGSFWPDIPADIRPKTSVRPSKSWKNKHFGTDIPRGRPRKKLRSEKLRADFFVPYLQHPE